MRSTLMSLSALLTSYAVLCMGHGLNNTLLGVRASLEGFSEGALGLMTTAYFAGFLCGGHLAGRMVPNVGQVRVFAAFASLASAVSLGYVLVLNEFTWVLLRFVYGMCFSTLFVVMEGWLTALSSRENRGKILAIYMTINFCGMSLGQPFLAWDPMDFPVFALVSILISLALVPLALSRTAQPEVSRGEKFGPGRLFGVSPLGSIGALANGLTMGSFWGLGSVYFTRIGLQPTAVAGALSLVFLGGLLFQWPIGVLSDRIGRRVAIVVAVGGSALACFGLVISTFAGFDGLSTTMSVLIFLFGGFGYTLFSLYIALVNDFLEPDQAIKAIGGLYIFHAVGAMVGPLACAALMGWLGPNGLFAFIGVINSMVFLVGIRQKLFGKIRPKAAEFQSLPKTTAAVLELDPRAHQPTGTME